MGRKCVEGQREGARVGQGEGAGGAYSGKKEEKKAKMNVVERMETEKNTEGRGCEETNNGVYL